MFICKYYFFPFSNPKMTVIDILNHFSLILDENICLYFWSKSWNCGHSEVVRKSRSKAKLCCVSQFGTSAPLAPFFSPHHYSQNIQILSENSGNVLTSQSVKTDSNTTHLKHTSFFLPFLGCACFFPILIHLEQIHNTSCKESELLMLAMTRNTIFYPSPG